jgi:dCTP deaminase
MSFWSSQTLKSKFKELNIVSPYCEDDIESASYNLTLGDEVYISFLPDTSQKDRKKVILKDKDTVAIPPGQFAFLITAEKVTIPENIIAFISIKFKSKAKGLVNVSGFHVDPGYSGKLIFAVYNAGPLNYIIAKGDRLFSIWFAELDGVDEKPKKGKGFDSIPTEFINIPDNTSLPFLVKRIDDLEKKVDKYSVVQAIIITVVIGLALAFIRPVVEKYLQANVPNSTAR